MGEARAFKSSLESRLKEHETKTEVVARLELQAKSMAQKIVQEKVEEHKQKELVIQSGHRACSSQNDR